uniref:Uncharacterized protein n=1 Tax=Arundo donax TaxID=35708 RepID=A0A0A8XPR2_ARUDO
MYEISIGLTLFRIRLKQLCSYSLDLTRFYKFVQPCSERCSVGCISKSKKKKKQRQNILLVQICLYLVPIKVLVGFDF